MPIKQKSSLPGTRSSLGLSPRDHGAIASALAPLMVIFVNVASPRPALGQTAKDKKPERFALYAPQPATLALADGDFPPVLRLAGRGARGNLWKSVDATPAAAGRQALLAALAPERARPAAADARADRRQRLDVQPPPSGHARGRRRDGVGRDV